MPIEPASVDLAFMVLVLHHVPDPGRAIDEAARIVRPSGRLVIVDMQPHERSEYRDLMGHQWLGFEAETIRKWGMDAGFERLVPRPLPAPPNAKGPLLFVATGTRT